MKSLVLPQIFDCSPLPKIDIFRCLDLDSILDNNNYDDYFQTVFLCTPSRVVREYCQRLREKFPGARIIDNSSTFRMDPDVHIVVPPVNGGLITPATKFYVNSNCVVAGLTVFLHALQRSQRGQLTRVRVVTFQSVSGSGYCGLHQLRRELQSNQPIKLHDSPYPLPIANNVIAQIGDINPDGWTEEEQKIAEETRKILNLPNLDITATCVRVPVERGHSLSVDVELSEPVTKGGMLPRGLVREAFRNFVAFPGPCPSDPLLLFQTGLRQSEAPVSHSQVTGTGDVYLSRLRLNPQNPNMLSAFLTIDNLYRGASFNSYQIAIGGLPNC